ncbi:MAG: flagellar export protein FliJ [Candidatus Xenobiia bacterium LiM19]
MKKFRFAFENVLKQREILEKLAQKRYFDLKRKILLEQQRVTKTEEMIQNLRQEMMEIQKNDGKRMTARTLQDYRSHLVYLDDTLLTIKGNINLLEKDMVSVRQALIHATQNKKIMVRLKEKAEKKHQVMVDSLDEKFMDEIATMRSHMEI